MIKGLINFNLILMKKYAFTVLLAVIGVCSLSAQDYKGSIGLRINPDDGGGAGVTIKNFTTQSTALEFIINTDFDSWIAGTGLFEVHQSIPDIKYFNWYYGAGAGVSLHSYPESYDSNNDGRIDGTRTHNGVGVGIDGILGIEYTIKQIPLALSLDWKPYLGLFENSGLHLFVFGFSARYTYRR